MSRVRGVSATLQRWNVNVLLGRRMGSSLSQGFAAAASARSSLSQGVAAGASARSVHSTTATADQDKPCCILDLDQTVLTRATFTQDPWAGEAWPTNQLGCLRTYIHNTHHLALHTVCPPPPPPHTHARARAHCAHWTLDLQAGSTVFTGVLWRVR